MSAERGGRTEAESDGEDYGHTWRFLQASIAGVRTEGPMRWPCPFGDFPHNFPEDEELSLQLPTRCPDSADPNPLAPPTRNMLGINYSADFDSWNSIHCQAPKTILDS